MVVDLTSTSRGSDQPGVGTVGLVTEGVRHLALIGIAAFLLRICPADDKTTAAMQVDRVWV
jgi:hypothetical protein